MNWKNVIKSSANSKLSTALLRRLETMVATEAGSRVIAIKSFKLS